MPSRSDKIIKEKLNIKRNDKKLKKITQDITLSSEHKKSPRKYKKEIKHNDLNEITEKPIVVEIPYNPWMSFQQAIKMFINGKFVARSGWKDYYLCRTNDINQIMISDPKRYSFRLFTPKLDDLIAEDWFVI